MSKSLSVFISSKMQELRDERQAMEELLPTLGEDTLRLHPWVFESDAPASEGSIRQVYLQALDESELYIGLYWNDYGEWTIDEFYRAGERGITRHVYVKDVDSGNRDPRLVEFLNRQSDVRFGITPRWFKDVDDLKAQVRRSVEQWLLDRQIAYHSATSAIIAHHEDDIPELPRRLIGRESLIEDVNDLLDDNERVLLRGFGGMGKTALAASIAAERVEDGKAPIIWIKAGMADANALFEAIARAFDSQQALTNKTGDERAQAVRSILAEHKKGLVVLDDAWNGTALAEFVKAIPRRMPLMVTSRQRFPLDEIVEIGELKPEEALKLLRYHARRDMDDGPDAGRLCETLGYHAFALEIAGKTLKVYDMTPGDLLKRIEEAPHDLQMPSGFGELGRSGIKSLLDASIDALNKDLLDLFMVMGGMFEPTATPELVALVAGTSQEQAGARLGELNERGLVNERSQQDVIYYRVHDLAYSYARAMFINRGLSETPVIEAVQQFTHDHRGDLIYLDIEQSNILEAVEAAQQAGSDAVVIGVMCDLAVHGPYFAARGHSSRSLQLMEATIHTALKHDEREAAHYLLSRLGNTYNDMLGDQARAFDAYDRALELARDLNLPDREAILLTVLGKVRFLQGADDAGDYYAQAEEMARHMDDEGALAFVLHHRGFYEKEKPSPDYETSRKLSDEAAQIAERLNRIDIHFFSLVNRGGCELDLGQADEALQSHQAALALGEQHNNRLWQAWALRSIGEDHHVCEQRDEAQAAFDRALDLLRQSGGKEPAEDLADYMEERGYRVKPE